ncbi:hypothetical protein VTO42DRAFT_84 [Malbranchea cinnamomea]
MAPRGGRRDGRKDASREVLISKALSYVLRHAAEREGVKIDKQGYANVGELLQWRKLKSMKVTFPEILEAVSSSDKQRFGLLYVAPRSAASKQEECAASSTATETKLEPSSEAPDVPPTPDQAQDGDDACRSPASAAAASATATAQALAANDPDPYHYLIRARQGHSIKTVDTASLLQRLTLDDGEAALPDTVVHGTYHAAWPKILASGGLRCMGRNHVHFASGPPLSAVLPDGIHGRVAALPSQGKHEGVISGMRADAQILIYIDLKRALRAGCPFWVSENGVILSEGMAREEEEEGGKEKVVPLEFFDVVVERKNGLGVLWEGGRLVKETPEWMLNAKAPAGKGERGEKGGKRGHKSAPRLKVEKETDSVDEP